MVPLPRLNTGRRFSRWSYAPRATTTRFGKTRSVSTSITSTGAANSTPLENLDTWHDPPHSRTHGLLHRLWLRASPPAGPPAGQICGGGADHRSATADQ